MEQVMQFISQPGILFVGLVWGLVWKGIALWQASTRKQVTWYVLLLIINTLGLLEIAYIIYLHKFDLLSRPLRAWWFKKFKK